MADARDDLLDLLLQVPPFHKIPQDQHAGVAADLSRVFLDRDASVFEEGDALDGIFIVLSGSVDIYWSGQDVVSHRGAGDLMGERGLLRDGKAMLSARAAEPSALLMLAASRFIKLTREVPEIGAWFGRSAPSTSTGSDGPYATGLMSLNVSDLMTSNPVTCAPDTSVQQVAGTMRDLSISSVLVMQDSALAGIVTVHDLVNKVLAEGLGANTPVREVMTPDPVTIAPDALGLDALLILAERRINHLPVRNAGRDIVGMIGRTDLFRQQATTASHMASELVNADNSAEMKRIMERLPELLSHLAAAGTRPASITRRITDLTDAITRRLLVLGEEKLGEPPVPYLWAACGSQGRREQTGVSDQDNCLILDERASEADDAYFEKLAQFVSDGLDHVGFVYCPGDMMATNPRWRQPVSVWRGYFDKWISEPDTEAQMLASVMFDLRPIAGDVSLFETLQVDTLEQAARNSIFVRHMIGNSLKHSPPLSLFRGLSVIRSGAHKNTIDLKHAGVVPIVDLGRVYALKASLAQVNTRERIVAAGEAGVISSSGAMDLLDAYDFIAETRLSHQAAQIKRGEDPDNFLDPEDLSELERTHLRDAFLVVKTMQSALAGA